MHNQLAAFTAILITLSIPAGAKDWVESTRSTPPPRLALWTDYNADGISDIAVYNSNGGYWYIRRVDDLETGALTFNAKWGEWGPYDYAAIPGDYDGDGKCDFAANGGVFTMWFITQLIYAGPSPYPFCFGQEWGTPDMTSVPGDYDGDGAYDLAEYDNTTGKWYIRSIAETNDPVIAYGLAWGSRQMRPVAGDYNGDGISDLAVFDTAAGRWYIRRVDDLDARPICFGISWGSSAMTPVPGDYNNDGVFDLCMYDSATGKWFIRNIADREAPPICFGTAWGGPTMVPVPGDYNGDGAYDLGVYDQPNGNWYIHSLGRKRPLVDALNWGGPGLSAVGAAQ